MSENLGDVEVAKTLLASGAAKSDLKYDELLIHAVEHNYLETVAFLLENSANIKAKNSQNESLLNIAISYKHREIIRFLISEGNICKKQNCDQDFLAAVEKDDIETVRLLLSQDINVNAKTVDYYGTAINRATHMGNLEMVKLLLLAGSDKKNENIRYDPVRYLESKYSLSDKERQILKLLSPNSFKLKNHEKKAENYFKIDNDIEIEEDIQSSIAVKTKIKNLISRIRSLSYKEFFETFQGFIYSVEIIE